MLPSRSDTRRWVAGLCLIASSAMPADTVTRAVRTFGMGELREVAVSPDGRHLGTAGPAGAFLWDLEQGTVQHRLEAHGGEVAVLAFSPDSRVMLSAGRDRNIRAWDTESGAALRVFSGHRGDVLCLAFAPDGRSFASGSADNTARTWSIESGEFLQLVEVPGAFIHAAAFTPDGRGLVTAATAPTNRIRLWDLASGTPIRTFADHALHTPALGFVAGGRLVSAGDDLQVRVWDVASGDLLRSMAGATLFINDLAVSADDPMVVAGCQDGRVIAWDSGTGEVRHNHVGDWLVALCARTGAGEVLTANADNRVRLRDLATGASRREFSGHSTSSTLGVGFSPDGRYVVSGGAEAATRLWNRTNAEPVRLLEGHGGGTCVAAFSPDGARVLTTRGAPKPAAQLWNTGTGELEREFGWSSGWPLCAVFSRDGTRVATGAQDGQARIWDLATGANTRTCLHAGWVKAVAFSPDGKRLASGSSDYTARLWDAENGELLRTFDLHAGSVRALAFSADGGRLLVGWEDGYLRVFDPATGDLQREIVVPAAYLNAAVFSPGGEFILTGEGWPFFTASLWDAHSGRRLRVFEGHGGPVDSVAFNAAGTGLLTGSEVVRLWSIVDLVARVDARPRPGSLDLHWRLGTLQRAPTAAGPWQTVPGSASPWATATDQPAAFFRISLPPRDQP